jgi:hypothetical protein
MTKMREEGDRLTRRALIEASLAGAVTTAVIATSGIGHAAPPTDAAASTGEPLGLRPGLRLGSWTVLDVRLDGLAIALVVRGPEGEPYQLDVLARDPERPGVAESERYSIFLVNEGDGATQSDEQRARGALAVGHYLRWAEEQLPQGPDLVTMNERMQSDPDGIYRVV